MAPPWMRKIVHQLSHQNDATRNTPFEVDYEKDKLRYWKQRKKELGDPKNPPYLPSQRSRALESPVTNEQKQSAFMQMPTEIRLAIYEALCGNRTIHLRYGFWLVKWHKGVPENNSELLATGSRKKRSKDDQWNFYHSLCPNNERYAPVAKHWHCEAYRSTLIHVHCRGGMTYTPNFDPVKCKTLQVLPLLLTCRKIYTEAIGVVYSTNTFSMCMRDWPALFEELGVLPQALLTPVRLSWLLVPHHFNAITSLDLNWTFREENTYKDGLTFDPALYKTWWRGIISMRGLQQLYLRLDMADLPSPITEFISKLFLDPIENLQEKGLKTFHIAAPESFFRIFHKLKKSSCTFSFFTYDHGRECYGMNQSGYTNYPPPSNGMPWDDGDWKRGDHDGVYFPIYDLPEDKVLVNNDLENDE